MMKGKKVVLTYGTFDLFHVGHLRLLKRLAALGDHLIVGVSSDEFNTIKGKSTIIPYEERVEIISSLPFVSAVIPENTWEQKKQDIRQYNVDIFAMGSDWTGKFDELKNLCQVIYLPRTQYISTTQIKHYVKNTAGMKMGEL